jgi:hypothetical protein
MEPPITLGSNGTQVPYTVTQGSSFLAQVSNKPADDPGWCVSKEIRNETDWPMSRYYSGIRLDM